MYQWLVIINVVLQTVQSNSSETHWNLCVTLIPPNEMFYNSPAWTLWYNDPHGCCDKIFTAHATSRQINTVHLLQETENCLLWSSWQQNWVAAVGGEKYIFGKQQTGHRSGNNNTALSVRVVGVLGRSSDALFMSYSLIQCLFIKWGFGSLLFIWN